MGCYEHWLYNTKSNYYCSSIVFTPLPNFTATCELENANISIIDNGDSYQWQLSTNGTTWADVSNTALQMLQQTP
jgi:hypothetical protein